MAIGLKSLKLPTNLLRFRSAITAEISEAYKPAAARNRNKLIEIIKGKVERARKSELAQKIKTAKGFYTLEMAPPSFNEMPKLKADLALLQDFFKSGCYKFLTVRQAWLLLLVGTEVGLWFFLGETIGKMHFVGYKV